MTARNEIVIAGAGPAGAFAALLLARSGAGVTLIERGRFPRPKLCGDTLNPGAVAALAKVLAIGPLAARARSIDGMLLTGPGPVLVRGEYGAGVRGLGVTREVFDAWLVGHAVGAGARLIDDTAVTEPELDDAGRVIGVKTRHRNGGLGIHRAVLTIAADGRRSRLGAACRLSRCAMRPRRWALGAYFADVEGLSSFGEMHVRQGHYLGVAPTADGRANACLVRPRRGPEADWRTPGSFLQRMLRADPVIGSRFARAAVLGETTVLGPLAVDTGVAGRPGLLLAGDAAGFIDPMTGDGIRLALASADLAAAVAAQVLDGTLSASSAYRNYDRALRRRLGRKQAFNRVMRGLVSSPRAVTLAAGAARIWPGLLRAAIRYAGDAPAFRA